MDQDIGVYEWFQRPDSEKLVLSILNDQINRSEMLGKLSNVLNSRTSTRLMDWIDHLIIDERNLEESDIMDSGFIKVEDMDGGSAYRCTEGILPAILILEEDQGLRLKVESIDDFAKKQGLDLSKAGGRFTSFREIVRKGSDGYSFGAVERRGYSGFGTPDLDDTSSYIAVLEGLMQRSRREPDDRALEELEHILECGIDDIGASRTADAFFFSERCFWESRNEIGKIQLRRQNDLGLGWGNHDHHTFRCSRVNFGRTISILKRIGMHARERFYAGKDAGWGAQVMEQNDCDIVVFADVDLSEDEIEGDITRDELPQEDQLGTVGLWVGLHGESITSAGMHHLAARVDFTRSIQDSKSTGLRPMSPFSDFDHLKQCFTEGERWIPSLTRLEELLEEKCITTDQFERFRRSGALGSHLELIERGKGFKGFNKDAVSDIIHRTDPRRTTDGNE